MRTMPCANEALLFILILSACMRPSSANDDGEAHSSNELWYGIGGCLLLLLMVYLCWCLLTGSFFYDLVPSYSRENTSAHPPGVLHVVIDSQSPRPSSAP